MHRQGTLKKRSHNNFYARLLCPPPPLPPLPPPAAVASSSSPPQFTAKKAQTSLQLPKLKGRLLGGDDDLALQNVVPAVTVVVEGRSICHRINLHHHANYQSLAKALRHMFLNYYGDDHNHKNNNHDDHNQLDDGDEGLDLSNAIPGHLVAYEDLENDLLLAGDLSWKDFVRVAKRIRILPVKSNSKRQRIINNLSNSSQNYSF